MGLSHTALGRKQYTVRALVNTAMNFRVPRGGGTSGQGERLLAVSNKSVSCVPLLPESLPIQLNPRLKYDVFLICTVVSKDN
jgi:hypothetical protein